MSTSNENKKNPSVLKRLKSLIKNNPKTFIAGAGLAGLGIAKAYKNHTTLNTSRGTESVNPLFSDAEWKSKFTHMADQALKKQKYREGMEKFEDFIRSQRRAAAMGNLPIVKTSEETKKSTFKSKINKTLNAIENNPVKTSVGLLALSSLNKAKNDLKNFPHFYEAKTKNKTFNKIFPKVTSLAVAMGERTSDTLKYLVEHPGKSSLIAGAGVGAYHGYKHLKKKYLEDK